MRTIDRRELLASLGLIGSCGLVAGCNSPYSLPTLAAADEGQQAAGRQATEPHPWTYVALDPAHTADTAYRIYPEGGCMFAVVGSVITGLAERVGEPFRSFPFEMMRYGDGGVGGWGSLCGVINGAAALIGLFHRQKPKHTREQLITELCVWYESTALPAYQPAQPQWAEQAEPSTAGSVLCHISVAKWCESTGSEAFCMEKKERCRRLAADGAARIVEILNRTAEDAVEAIGLTPEVQSCLDCHGRQEQADAMGNMQCAACHSFQEEHP